MQKKINSSPDRFTFQKDSYVKRMAEESKEPSDDYLEWFDSVIEQNKHKWDDPASHENNMEYDLVTTDWICDKAKASDVYAQNLYAAMCNNDFQRNDMMPILAGKRWSCSWRYAGGIVADMREKGDYIDWYCSGIRDTYDGGYVSESVVTDEVRADLKRLGWIVVDDGEVHI